MTEIYIIRHVQAEGNLYRMCQGHWDGGVTPLGVKQRDALAERFKDIHIDALYSSDLYRARFTASAITKYHALPVNMEPRLREINLGPWETMYFGNLRREYPEDFRKFIFDQPSFKIDNAETYGDVTDRAYAALEDIAKANDGKTVAITTHGVTIRCLLCKIAGIDLSDNERLPIFMNTGVAKLTYDNGRFDMLYSNDYSHLSEDLQHSMKVPDLRHEFIDPAKEADYYNQCYSNSWLAAHGSLNGYNANTYLSCAIEHYRQDPESVQRLYYNDEPAGLLDLDVDRGSHAGYGWITLLYLEPEFRSKGCGIQLLSRAMLKYERLGRKSLRLHVAEDNRAALKFYKKWGFKELSSQPGNDCRLILMERKLGGHEYI